MNDHRQSKRFPFRWPVALVFDHNASGHRPIFHGTTRDISMGGCSLLTDHNIFSEAPLNLLLSLPAESPLGKRQVLEIRARMAYTILASGYDRFRCGLEFISFKGEGRHLLTEAIERRIPSASQ